MASRRSSTPSRRRVLPTPARATAATPRRIHPVPMPPKVETNEALPLVNRAGGAVVPPPLVTGAAATEAPPPERSLGGATDVSGAALPKSAAAGTSPPPLAVSVAPAVPNPSPAVTDTRAPPIDMVNTFLLGLLGGTQMKRRDPALYS